jgi:hypothetical protein
MGRVGIGEFNRVRFYHEELEVLGFGAPTE